MSKEIERKFLVTGNFKQYSKKIIRIVQGYLSDDPEKTVRIRMTDTKGYITIKGISNDTGVSRNEWEYEIPFQEALEMLDLCESRIVKKRHLVDVGSHTFEIDVFEKLNKGLIIAEIELESEDDEFEKPDWLGEEVTGDVKYYNSMLLKHPYTTW